MYDDQDRPLLVTCFFERREDRSIRVAENETSYGRQIVMTLIQEGQEHGR